MKIRIFDYAKTFVLCSQPLRGIAALSSFLSAVQQASIVTGKMLTKFLLSKTRCWDMGRQTDGEGQ